MNGLAGGLHPQTVCQIEGLESIIKCRGAVVGGTRGVGQSMGVDSWNWAILIMDVGGKFGILGTFAMSMGLLATTSVVTLMLDINIVVVYLPDYISARAHYSRLRSTIVPLVACQTTEGEYLLLTTLLLTDTL